MADRKITALTELTAPVAADVFPVIDVSESANANKNKKIQLTTVLKNIPNGTVAAPSVGFTGDSGLTGFFRVASNEIGISANQGLIGSFTTTGFQLGSGTPAAQLHLFSTDTTDQVIIENTDTGADNAPDLVLFRNSASPAADDNLGNLVYRGEDAAGNAHDYASVVASIETTTDGSEDGILDIMSSASGTLASRIRLKNNKVGIGESDPIYPMHLTTTLTGQALQLQCDADDAASGANLMLYHRRGASGAGQDNDVISTIFYRGKNDAGTPEEVDFVGLEGVITDASDGTEDGKLNLQVMTAGTLTTKLAIDATGINITGTVTDDGAVHDGNVDLNGNIDVSGTSTLNDDVTFTGASANILFDKSDNALEFAHDAKSIYGDAANFQIYHNSNGSFISHEATSAKLFIQTNSSAGIEINKGVSENIAKFIPDGAVELYHNNVKKVETSATGIDVTGNINLPDSTSNTVGRIMLGDGTEMQIQYDGGGGFIGNFSGNLTLHCNALRFMNGAKTENFIVANENSSVEIYHDNVKRLETTSTGADITGVLTTDGANHNGDVQFFGSNYGAFWDKSASALKILDNARLIVGTASDLTLVHDGTDSKITNITGNLFIEAKTSETAIKIIPDGAVEIYHDAVKKAETTSSGITVTGTVTETSDIAYKSDIKPITNTLDKLQQITGYKYKLDNASIDSMGVIAQDVEKVFPELVHGDEGSKTLQYSGLIGVLVEAVKDLSAKVKKLESN